MNLKKVYRLQDRDGYGPYWGKSGNWLEGRMGQEHSGDPSRPARWEDDLGKRYADGREWCYGCPSLNDLAWWFEDWLAKLLLSDYWVVEYEVVEELFKLGRSGRQCQFCIEAARELGAVEWSVIREMVV